MASLYAEPEITLSKRSADFYAVTFRFNRPNHGAEQSFPSDETVSFDLSAIRAKRGDDCAASLTTAAASEDRLRVRLSIEPSATELHALHWEMLNDPRSPDSPLFMGDNIVCSRFLTSSRRWGPLDLRLLFGHQGEADINGDGLVTADELAEYVHTEVRAYTNGKQNPTSHPGGFDPDMLLSFPPVRLPTSDPRPPKTQAKP
jgi:hypothetical protein